MPFEQLNIRLASLRSPHYWTSLSITARSRAFKPKSTTATDALALHTKLSVAAQRNTASNFTMFRPSPVLEQRQAGQLQKI